MDFKRAIYLKIQEYAIIFKRNMVKESMRILQTRISYKITDFQIKVFF